jgi:signal transduction histidine kinase
MSPCLQRMTVPSRISALAKQAHRATATGSGHVAYRHRLSARLWRLTILAVMLAEVLIFVPSIANYRKEWLRQRIETAAVAGLTAERASGNGDAALGPEEQASLLRALDARLIATSNGTVSRLLARDETLGSVDAQVDIGNDDWLSLIAGAFDTLLFGEDRMMRTRGPVGEVGMVAEVVIAESQLRRAMLIYSRNIFILSLAIAFFAALLVYLAISYLLIRPILAMTRSLVQFGENPADSEQIIKPSGRPDEIGLAELELAGMQTTLAQTLREQRHLADLGLAVSKINHDLRNVLASAQIVSDRLSDLEDPRVQRFAPQLIRSLDRALAYTQSVLAYGRAVESAPVRRKVRLRRLVEEVFETAVVSPQVAIELINDVAETCEVDVDPDQFFRVLSNLCRNAVQALESEDSEAVIRRIAVSARRLADGQMLIAVEDTGPGLPMRAREHLFEAFRGSTRAGGTGLGLAIAAEIVEAHGGRIALCSNTASGARFEIHLPARPGGEVYASSGVDNREGAGGAATRR